MEELQLCAQAEATGREALAGSARVPWAMHAVAHLMEMQGRFTEGSAWLAHWQADWTDGNGFQGHLGWHHALLALIGSGDLLAARAWAASVTEHAELAPGHARAVARDVGVPLMRGLLAFAEERFDDPVQTLYPLRAPAQRLGGSHAQRDLIVQTVLAAAARAGNTSAGRALLNERRLAKPATSLTEHWAARIAAAAHPST